MKTDPPQTDARRPLVAPASPDRPSFETVRGLYHAAKHEHVRQLIRDLAAKYGITGYEAPFAR